MDNSVIEELGVCAVKTRVNTMGFIKAFIDSNDKTPIWDGDLYVYNSESKYNNETFSFRVPLQVKASELKKKEVFPPDIHHGISKSALKHYLNDGGVVFFKALVTRNAQEVYYVVLTKRNINKLLHSNTNKSVQLKLFRFDCTVSDFLSELRSLYLQVAHETKNLSSIASESYTINIEPVPATGDPYEYLATHFNNMLIEMQSDPSKKYYPSEGRSKMFFIHDIDCSVRIEDEEYFNKVKLEYTEKGRRFNIGDCFSILIPYNGGHDNPNKVNVDYHPKYISEAIAKLKFLIPLLSKRKIQIGDLNFELPYHKEFDDILPTWNKILKTFIATKQLFASIYITDELRVDNLDDSDEMTARMLLLGYHRNLAMQSPQPPGDFRAFKIGNLNIIFLSRHVKGNIYQLFDINESARMIETLDNGISYPVSTYAYAFRYDFFPDNINFEAVLPNYKRVYEEDKNGVEEIVIDLLHLIKHFDRTQKLEIIKLAKEIATWLNSENTDTPEIMFLNLIQIKTRLKETLTSEETQKLFEIKESTTDMLIKFACSVLLEEKKSSRFIFEYLSEENKATVQGWPIYHLYENLNSNNNE